MRSICPLYCLHLPDDQTETLKSERDLPEVTQTIGGRLGSLVSFCLTVLYRSSISI